MKVLVAEKMTHPGGTGYVFWGGREGYQCLWNTNMQRELDAAVANQLKSQVMDELHRLHTVQLPQAMIGQEIQNQKQQMLQQFVAGQAHVQVRLTEQVDHVGQFTIAQVGVVTFRQVVRTPAGGQDDGTELFTLGIKGQNVLFAFVVLHKFFV